MTGVLLDTHTYLWFVFDDPRLSRTATRKIENADVTKLLSVVSLWEIAIKAQIGKLRLGMSFAQFLDDYVTTRELDLVDIELSHLLAYDALPLEHRDPFDRLLIAQARVLKGPIVSANPALRKYKVQILW